MHNARLDQWIKEIVSLCHPENVHLCDGSLQEHQKISQLLVNQGVFVPLNPKLRPNSFWCHSHPDDVARAEQCTYICSKSQEDAGPTNNWKDPEEMHALLKKLFSGCMEGRTLYVIPFSMGPLGSPIAKIGVQITDSPYVVASMYIMARIGKKVLDVLGDGFFVPCLHSIGVPLKKGEKDMPWPCRPDQKYIVHFPEEKSIWSFGSGYGGNALLGKKCLSLRIASVLGRDEMWLAEHMLIMGVTNPAGEKKYFAAAFPSACGKTNLAMMRSALPGWKVECVGDDIAWMKFKKDGTLHAINPETGIFGVAPGTSYDSNPNAMETIKKNAIFTNVALTKDHDVWWEGMTKEPPKEPMTNWLGHPWTKDSKERAAHANSRFTAPIAQSPVIDPKWQDPEGVPISGIIFGGRRSNTIPLVAESFNWQHGVFFGASMSSEITAAQTGEIGKLRHDPFAMLPFCGYNMGDYFNHWLEMGHEGEHLPRIFYVNWFQKSPNGEYLWPGYGENIRVIKWMFERISKNIPAEKTPIGWVPKEGSLDVSGLNIPKENLKALFHIDPKGWIKEADALQTYFYVFGDHLPQGLRDELEALKERLIL